MNLKHRIYYTTTVADSRFSRHAGTNPRGDVNLLFGKLLAENYKKKKVMGLRGAHIPSTPTDPPMNVDLSKTIEHGIRLTV